jgi:uncharacterized membrane protein
MDVTASLLLWIHLVALGLGGAAVFGVPVVGARLASATAETRPSLFAVIRGLSTIGRAAVAVLVISGPILFWLKWDFHAPSAMWFGIKMLLVLILLGLVIFAGINGKRAQGGDMAAAARSRPIGMASMATYLLVVLSAVFAFG